MKGQFYFCDNCDKKQRADNPIRINGTYRQPTGWVSVTEKLNESMTSSDFCSKQCAIIALSGGVAMSIQRYEPTEWGQMDADTNGGWITYADHVAKIKSCITAVENLPVAIYSYKENETLRDVGFWKSNIIETLLKVLV